MVNYSKGKIYKVVCDETNKTYYGSTTNTLSRRMCQHRTNPDSTISKEMTKPKIYLIEDFSCDRKEQLLQRERHFIENNECINRSVPLRTKRENYIANKEDINLKCKIYHIENKESISLNKKEYYEKNKETINLRRKNKISCECGSVFTIAGKSLHKKSKKHIKYVNSI